MLSKYVHIGYEHVVVKTTQRRHLARYVPIYTYTEHVEIFDWRQTESILLQ